jgi:hypothetical protein
MFHGNRANLSSVQSGRHTKSRCDSRQGRLRPRQAGNLLLDLSDSRSRHRLWGAPIGRPDRGSGPFEIVDDQGELFGTVR